MNPVQVIGCDGSGFSAEARNILRNTELLLGGRRLLALAAPELREGTECVELGAALVETLAAALARRNGRAMTLLASGDPLCCGIGGTLRRLAPEEAFEFHPAPTAFQQLFARLGEPWEKMSFFSLHGEAEALPFRRILRAPLAAVYCDAERTAQCVASELIARFPDAAGRRAAVGCDLGLRRSMSPPERSRPSRRIAPPGVRSLFWRCCRTEPRRCRICRSALMTSLICIMER